MVRLIQRGRLGLAPVQNPKNVVDVCTGTGIWATEYGMYPVGLTPSHIPFGAQIWTANERRVR